MAKISFELQKKIKTALSNSNMLIDQKLRIEYVKSCLKHIGKDNLSGRIDYDGNSIGFTTELFSFLNKYKEFEKALIFLLNSAIEVENLEDYKTAFQNILIQLKIEIQ
jgi:hypothetical protein